MVRIAAYRTGAMIRLVPLVSATAALLLVGCVSTRSEELPRDDKSLHTIATSLTGEQRQDFLVYVNALKRGMPMAQQPRTVADAIRVGRTILTRERDELAEDRMAINAMRNADN